MDPDSVEYLGGSPILLSIMCSLVKNKRIVSSGEIVSQLMICLYQYYTRRTGIEYQFKEYLSVLKKLGPLALQMLLSQTYPGFKSQVIREVGKDAFDLGILVGEEGYFNLVKNNSGDMSLSFLDTAIKQFLGAYHFIQTSSNAKMSNHTLHQTKQPIQLVNKLFVDMCFWFLLNRNDYFNLEGLELSYEKLTLNFFQSIFAGCDAHLPLILESIYKQTRGALDRIYPMIEMVSKDSLNVIWFSDSRIIIWLGSVIDSIDVFIEKSKILSKNLFPMVYLSVCKVYLYRLHA